MVALSLELPFFLSEMDKIRIEKEIEALLDSENCELVDFRVLSQKGKPLLVFYIDRKEGGITLDECGQWSEKIGAYIDLNQPIQAGYVLEVSSPGVDRILKKEKDFKRFSGRSVKIKLTSPINGTRVYYGILSGFVNGEVILDNGTSFNLANIDEVRLDPKDLI